jgi:hypothetical protein
VIFKVDYFFPLNRPQKLNAVSPEYYTRNGPNRVKRESPAAKLFAGFVRDPGKSVSCFH